MSARSLRSTATPSPASQRSRPRRSASAREPGQVAAPADRPHGHWTFLSNHAHVLILLARDPSMVLREVAAQVGITERAVQRIIADLEGEGFIERERVGRRNHYRIRADRHLRHTIEAHRTIGDLIELVRIAP